MTDQIRSDQIKSNHTIQLRTLMQSVGIASFRGLAQAAGISDWQIELLRRGRINQMRVEPLLKLSQTLRRSVAELIAAFSDQSLATAVSVQIGEAETLKISENTPSDTATELRQEYQQLQVQLAQQRTQLQQEFQQTTLQMLESWMLQFPTAAYAAQQNPTAPAHRLLPLMRPIEQLLKSWGIEMLAPVGSEVAYDPQWHQLLEGTAQPGELVRVRYAGYLQEGKLLYRARVSRVEG